MDDTSLLMCADLAHIYEGDELGFVGADDCEAYLFRFIVYVDELGHSQVLLEVLTILLKDFVAFD